MKHLKTKQQGLSHILLVFGVVITISVVAFGAYRVGSNSTNNSELQNASEQQEIDQEDELVAVEPKEEEKETIEIAAEKTELQKIEESKEEEVKKQEPVQQEKKKEKRYIEMTKVSAQQSGSVVKIVSRLPEKLSGTCHYKLYQEGYERIYSSNSISNATDCVGQLNVADAPTYEGWELHVWFDNTDFSVFGYQLEEAFPLSNPN
jgi:HD-GYP domain-containing protein (c-di-GMP phosphodiesterase class II)